MKKLMIAAAIVCAAAMSQAATVSWSVSSTKTANYGVEGKADGSFSGTTCSTATFAVYLVSESVFGNTSLDKILDYSKTHTADFSGTVDSMGNKTFTTADKYTTGDKIYALELLTYSDKNGDWYIANKSWAEITAIGETPQSQKMTGLNTKVGGQSNAQPFPGSGATITGWQSVPEPTSGLLLLLGVAGLALRRRRA